MRYADLLPRYKTYERTIKEIVSDVQKKYKVSMNDIMSVRRERAMVNARHEIVLRIYKKTTMTEHSIGKLMGKDHTTINHILKKKKK